MSFPASSKIAHTHSNAAAAVNIACSKSVRRPRRRSSHHRSRLDYCAAVAPRSDYSNDYGFHYPTSLPLNDIYLGLDFPRRMPQRPLSPGSGGVTEDAFHIPTMPSDLLMTLNEMRHQAECTDTILCVGTREFHCHRAILAANSPYFRAMFANNMRERSQTRVSLHEVSPAMLDILIDFSYGTKILITEENAQDLYVAANFLQFEGVSKACCKFLQKNLRACNCLALAKFAEMYRCLPLQGDAEGYVLAHFEEVSQSKDFLDLKPEQLMTYIRHDHLKTRSEKVVLDAVLRWLHHDLLDRDIFRNEILKCVRLPLLDEKSLVEIGESRNIRFEQSKVCQDAIQEAKYCQWLMKRGYRVLGPGTAHRRQGKKSDVIVLVGGHRKDADGDYVYSDEVFFTEVSDPSTVRYPTWHPLAKMPHHLKRKYSVTVLESNVFVSGGYDAVCDQSCRLVWRYSFTRNLWKPVASLLHARHSHGSANLDGKLYVVGGKSSVRDSRLESVEVYHPEEDEWREIASLPIAVSVPSVIACAGRLYVIGGATDAESACAQVQCYDPITDAWSILPDVEFYRKTLRAVAIDDDSFLVIGGRKTRDAVQLSPSTSEERVLESANEQRTFPGVTTAIGKVWLMGGKVGDEARSSAECYDPKTGVWTTMVGFLPRPLYMQGCVTISSDS